MPIIKATEEFAMSPINKGKIPEGFAIQAVKKVGVHWHVEHQQLEVIGVPDSCLDLPCYDGLFEVHEGFFEE